MGGAEIQGPRQGSGWDRETRRVLGPQWVVYRNTPTPITPLLIHTHILDFGNPQLVDRVIFQGEIYVRNFHATSNVTRWQTFLASKTFKSGE